MNLFILLFLFAILSFIKRVREHQVVLSGMIFIFRSVRIEIADLLVADFSQTEFRWPIKIKGTFWVLKLFK